MADFQFDPSQFAGGLNAAREAVMQAAVAAVNKIGNQVLGNAQEYAPLETGFLQSSGTAGPAEVKGDSIAKQMGFNAAYAAARHENPPQHDAGRRQNPKGQWKYMERALREGAQTFGADAAKLIGARLK